MSPREHSGITRTDAWLSITTTVVFLKTLKEQDLGSLPNRSFTSKLLIIGDQLKTIYLEGFQELVLENTKGQCHHFGTFLVCSRELLYLFRCHCPSSSSTFSPNKILEGFDGLVYV